MATLRINGTEFSFDCPPDTPLLWAIRDAAGLTGTRPGCLVGLCGACTVHLDGVAVRPCSIPVVRAEGCTVTTIEAVLATTLGRALERVWSEDALHSCEQCRPGRIMAAAALLMRCAEPTDEEVATTLADHVCDCGGPGDAGEILRRAARLTRAAADAERSGSATVHATSGASAKPERTIS